MSATVEAVALPLVLNVAGGLYRAEYADGSPVEVGHRVRYQQASGGILPSTGIWRAGTVIAMPETHRVPGAPATVVLEADNGRLFNLVGHIIERLEVGA